MFISDLFIFLQTNYVNSDKHKDFFLTDDHLSACASNQGHLQPLVCSEKFSKDKENLENKQISKNLENIGQSKINLKRKYAESEFSENTDKGIKNKPLSDIILNKQYPSEYSKTSTDSFSVSPPSDYEYVPPSDLSFSSSEHLSNSKSSCSKSTNERLSDNSLSYPEIFKSDDVKLQDFNRHKPQLNITPRQIPVQDFKNPSCSSLNDFADKSHILPLENSTSVLEKMSDRKNLYSNSDHAKSADSSKKVRFYSFTQSIFIN